MRLARTLTLAAALAALAAPAFSLEAPKDYAGPWTISGVSEGAEVCTVTLGDEGAIGGWTIDVPQDCFEKFGFSPDVAAWTVYPDGAIGFIDPLRTMLLRFEPAEIGGYVATPDEGEPLSLDRVDPDARELTEQERMAGRWSLMSMGDRLCTWISSSEPDGMKGSLAPAGECRLEWRKVAKWERHDLSLRLLDEQGRAIRTLAGESVFGFYTPPDSDENIGFVRD